MATPINAPMAGEIWHLSIEDLFQPVQEAPRLGGEGPFVINLSVSTAPINVPGKPFTGCRDGHIYQIQVTEDGRTRFRLRLGPFMTEDEADAVLAEVREIYPGALTATASDSDLRVISSMKAKIEARQAPKKTQEPVLQTMAAQTTPVPNAVQQSVVPQLVVPQSATLQAAIPSKIPPQKTVPAAAVAAPVVAATAAEADAEISIDIAWPTPELVIPAASPPRDLAPQWSLPELDIPLPAVAAGTAKVAPVLTEMVAPVAKAAAPKAVAPTPMPVAPMPVVAPTPIVIAAPVLTEAVTAKPKTPSTPAVKAPTPKIAASNASATPAIVAPPPAVAPPLAIVPTLTLAAAPPAVRPPPVIASPPVAKSPVVKPPPVIKPPPIITPPARAAAPVAPPAAPSLPKRPAQVAVKQAAPPVKQVHPAVKPSPVLTQSVASPPKASAQKQRQSTFNTSANKLTSLQHVVVATAPAPAAREVKKLDKPLESLESTQTIRALTPMELEDIEASRWFVIQLALADHAFDPDAVPNLDLFDEYRLYSVAGLDQGRVVHSLRLGFFREEIGAVAVASYLAAYWEKPTIKRVSLAERERFADQRVEARKDVGATGKHAVIEITDELVARRRRTSKIAVAAKSSSQPLGH
jgi:SPOR domain